MQSYLNKLLAIMILVIKMSRFSKCSPGQRSKPQQLCSPLFPSALPNASFFKKPSPGSKRFFYNTHSKESIFLFWKQTEKMPPDRSAEHLHYPEFPGKSPYTPTSFFNLNNSSRRRAASIKSRSLAAFCIAFWV